eukprot:1072535-Alexandrium_andersonii.AAC.1
MEASRAMPGPSPKAPSEGEPGPDTASEASFAFASTASRGSAFSLADEVSRQAAERPNKRGR